MSTIYVDTSALVKFYYPEVGSETVENLLLKATRVLLSHLSVLEMASVLSKKLRTRELSLREKADIWAAFLSDLKSAQVEMVPIRSDHMDHAVALVNEFGNRLNLRTLDALHLAVARLAACEGLLTSDRAMAAVGRRLSMKVTCVS